MRDASKFVPPPLKSRWINGDPHPEWSRLLDLGGLLTLPVEAATTLPGLP
jgi:hypothetical protein